MSLSSVGRVFTPNTHPSKLIDIYSYPSVSKLSAIESSLAALGEIKGFYNLLRAVSIRREVNITLEFSYCETYDSNCKVTVTRDDAVIATFTKRLSEYIKNNLRRHAQNVHFPLYLLATFLLQVANKENAGSKMHLEYKSGTLSRVFAELPTTNQIVLLYVAGFVSGLSKQKSWKLPVEVKITQDQLLREILINSCTKISDYNNHKPPWFFPQAHQPLLFDIPNNITQQLSVESVAKHESINQLTQTDTLPTITGFVQALNNEANLIVYNLEDKLAATDCRAYCMDDDGRASYAIFKDTQNPTSPEYIIPFDIPVIFTRCNDGTHDGFVL